MTGSGFAAGRGQCFHRPRFGMGCHGQNPSINGRGTTARVVQGKLKHALPGAARGVLAQRASACPPWRAVSPPSEDRFALPALPYMAWFSSMSLRSVARRGDAGEGAARTVPGEKNFGVHQASSDGGAAAHGTGGSRGIGPRVTAAGEVLHSPSFMTAGHTPWRRPRSGSRRCRLDRMRRRSQPGPLGLGRSEKRARYSAKAQRAFFKPGTQHDASRTYQQVLRIDLSGAPMNLAKQGGRICSLPAVLLVSSGRRVARIPARV